MASEKVTLELGDSILSGDSAGINVWTLTDVSIWRLGQTEPLHYY